MIPRPEHPGQLERPLSAPAPVATPARESVRVLALEPEARRVSSPPMALPGNRSFRAENEAAALPKVMIAEPRAASTPPKAQSTEAKAARTPSVPAPSPSVPAPAPAPSPSVPAPSPSVPAPARNRACPRLRLRRAYRACAHIAPARACARRARARAFAERARACAEVPAPARTRGARACAEVPAPAPSPSIPAPSPSIPGPSPSIPAPSPSLPAPGMTFADHAAEGDIRLGPRATSRARWRRTSGRSACSAPTREHERAEIYVRIGQIEAAAGASGARRSRASRRRSRFPDARGPSCPRQRRDGGAGRAQRRRGRWRAVAGRGGAAARASSTIPTSASRGSSSSATRWQDDAGDPARARAALERARELQPGRLGVLARLAGALRGGRRRRRRRSRRGAGSPSSRRDSARARRAATSSSAQYCSTTEARGARARAASTSRSRATRRCSSRSRCGALLADRQEWSELEQAYRRMLDARRGSPRPEVRTEVTWELCRRLGLLFRDHLEDPALALDAFEDAVDDKPGDLPSRLIAAELARSLGELRARRRRTSRPRRRSIPARVATFHDLFELFQKLRRPDQAYPAACVTMLPPRRPRRASASSSRSTGPRACPSSRTRCAPRRGSSSARAIATCTSRRCSRRSRPRRSRRASPQLAEEAPARARSRRARQDPEKTTVSIVRSFAWASHFLGVAAAGDLPPRRRRSSASPRSSPRSRRCSRAARAPRALAARARVPRRAPPRATTSAAHRLLLYYPSIEELSACFLAAREDRAPRSCPRPPAAARRGARARSPASSRGLDERRARRSPAAVAAFESRARPRRLAGWVGAVERCATRAGYLARGRSRRRRRRSRSDALGAVGRGEDRRPRRLHGLGRAPRPARGARHRDPALSFPVRGPATDGRTPAPLRGRRARRWPLSPPSAASASRPARSLLALEVREVRGVARRAAEEARDELALVVAVALARGLVALVGGASSGSAGPPS